MLRDYFNEEDYEILVGSNDQMFKALEIISRLFDNKCDKSGMPYSVHLLKVYSGVSDYDEKICALLHDVIEDTNVTYEELMYVGIKMNVINMLRYLTKLKGEDYNHYIDRIISSDDIHVLNIKLADLKHNMDIKRIKNPSLNDYERVNKRYLPAYEKIQNQINELKGENYVRY